MNHIACVVSAVLMNALGFLIYGKLSTPWLTALGKTPEEIQARPKGGHEAALYTLANFRSLVLAYTVAHYFELLKVGPGAFEDALFHAVLLGTGFVLLPAFTNYVFTHDVRRALVLISIDGAFDMLSILLVALMLVNPLTFESVFGATRATGADGVLGMLGF